MTPERIYCAISNKYELSPMGPLVFRDGKKKGNEVPLRKNKANGRFYVRLTIEGKRKDLLANKVVFAIGHGYWPTKLIGFKDADRENLLLSNLEEVDDQTQLSASAAARRSARRKYKERERGEEE